MGQSSSLIGQLARIIELFHGKIVMYALVTISESVFLPRGPGYWNKQHFGMR